MSHAANQMDTSPCWVELKAAELIAKIKRSQYAASCFADARNFAGEGYVMDVALAMAMAWNYWK